MAWLALAGLGIWDLNDATGPKAVPQASLFLGIVAALFLVAVVRRLRSRAVLPHAPLFLVGGCFAVGIAMIPFRPDYHPEYVLSDLGTLAFFVLCLVLAALYREELTSHRTVVLFVALYIVIALVAYYAAVTDLRPEYWWNGRWDPPYYMLFGGLALLARYTDSLPKRLVSSSLLVAMLGLALFSGNRTQFALGLVFVALAWASNRVMVFLMSLGFVAFLFLRQIGVITFDPFADLFAESRFALLEGGLDDSLLGRLQEVHDIWYYLTVLNTPEQTIFGRGAGATWHPITRELADAGGEIYYLHTGLAHMSFRFGALGLILFIFWLWVSVANLRIMFDAEATIGERFWCLGALGFSLNFFLQNSLYDPPAVLAMAVLLVIAQVRSARPPSGSRTAASTSRSRPVRRRESAAEPAAR